MAVQTIDISELTRQLLALGVQPGGVLVVHAAFSKVGPVAGGPRGLIEALLTALGSTGTLVMPSMTDDDDHPFDPKQTPCAGMGAVADTFWRMPGVMRSDSPHAFAAIGPKAAAITAAHPVDVPHGPDCPIGRVYELDGQVLLLGVGHDADTSVHLAENVAGVRYRQRKHSTIIRGGQPVRYDYDEIDHCCQNFDLLDPWLEVRGRQRRGVVGHAEARLARSRDVVEAAVTRLRENEAVFLHPAGSCSECDEARASLTVTVEPLAAHRDALPLLEEWFKQEWPSHYGSDGPGDARRDLQSFANLGSLPVGVVALRDGKVCGVAALKAESIASHRHLGPWAAAGLVEPILRGQGIGAGLLHGLEEQARALGFRRIYCGTSTAESLLQRGGWELVERIVHEGQDLGIYSKAL